MHLPAVRRAHGLCGRAARAHREWQAGYGECQGSFCVSFLQLGVQAHSLNKLFPVVGEIIWKLLAEKEKSFDNSSAWDFHWDGRGDYLEAQRCFYGDFS